MEKDVAQLLLARGSMTAPVIDHPAGGVAIMVPEGYDLTHLQKAHQLPPYISASPVFSEMDSFVAYVNEYKGEGTKVFGDIDRSQLVAYLDYHKKGVPDYVGHSATFMARLSDEWRAWDNLSASLVGQVAFAEFLEEWGKTVQAPDGATLLEIITTLEAKTDVTFKSKVKLAQGGMQSLVFEENQEAKGGGNVALPTELTLGIPVYRGGDGYQIRVFLRCKIEHGKAMFAVKIHEANRVKQFAFKSLCEKAEAATDLIILHGAADGSSTASATPRSRDYR